MNYNTAKKYKQRVKQIEKFCTIRAKLSLDYFNVSSI